MTIFNKKKSSKPRIAILVDNPFRDLLGATLVAWELARKGAICYLVPSNLKREIWSLIPDFVLLNHFKVPYENLVSNLIKAGIQVGVMETEAGVFGPLPHNILEKSGMMSDEKLLKEETDPLEEYALFMAKDNKLRDQITYFFSWNEPFTNYAIKSGWYRDDQIFSTGTPRTDFLSGRWRNAAIQISRYVDDFDKPMVLFVSNFSLANSRFQNSTLESEMLIKTYNLDRDFLEGYKKAQEIALDEFVGLARFVASKFPKVAFIYRPHPFENSEIYEKHLSGLDNLHLVKKGFMGDWLIRSKAIVHWNSSSAIEASLVGIPAFTASWIPTYITIPAVQAVSKIISSSHELVSNLEEMFANRFTYSRDEKRKINKTIEDIYFKVDGLAYKRIADKLYRSLEKKMSYPSLWQCKKMNYQVDHVVGWNKLITYSRMLFGVSKHFKFRKGKIVLKLLEWDVSDRWADKRFDHRKVMEYILAIESNLEKEMEDGNRISVFPADEKNDYKFGYRQGRTVVVKNIYSIL